MYDVNELDKVTMTLFKLQAITLKLVVDTHTLVGEGFGKRLSAVNMNPKGNGGDSRSAWKPKVAPRDSFNVMIRSKLNLQSGKEVPGGMNWTATNVYMDIIDIPAVLNIFSAAADWFQQEGVFVRDGTDKITSVRPLVSSMILSSGMILTLRPTTISDADNSDMKYEGIIIENKHMIMGELTVFEFLALKQRLEEVGENLINTSLAVMNTVMIFQTLESLREIGTEMRKIAYPGARNGNS